MYSLWSALLLLCSFVCAQGFAVDLEEYDADDFDREGRIFTSGGSLNLNSTFLTAAAGLLAAGLLGLLALLAFAPRTSSSSSGGYGGYGSQRNSQDYYDYADGDDFGYRRRSGPELVDDFTEQLNRLAEAFHKYEIDEAQGCQLYVACESSNVAQHYKNGPLAKTVYTVMRTISAPENSHLYEDDKYLQDILQAFKAGSSGESCEYFRKQCRKDKVFG